MFRDVPECSGMFRVPGFIDGHLSHDYFSRKPAFGSVAILCFPELRIRSAFISYISVSFPATL